MASVKLSQLYGGGEFKAEFFSGSLSLSIGPGSPLTISPATGKTLRLDFLAPSSGTIGATSVTAGSTVVVSSKTLVSAGASAANGQFTISNGGQGSHVVAPIIAFEPDQAITLSSASSGTLLYSYSYGE